MEQKLAGEADDPAEERSKAKLTYKGLEDASIVRTQYPGSAELYVDACLPHGDSTIFVEVGEPKGQDALVERRVRDTLDRQVELLDAYSSSRAATDQPSSVELRRARPDALRPALPAQGRREHQ